MNLIFSFSLSLFLISNHPSEPHELTCNDVSEFSAAMDRGNRELSRILFEMETVVAKAESRSSDPEVLSILKMELDSLTLNAGNILSYNPYRGWDGEERNAYDAHRYLVSDGEIPVVLRWNEARLDNFGRIVKRTFELKDPREVSGAEAEEAFIFALRGIYFPLGPDEESKEWKSAVSWAREMSVPFWRDPIDVKALPSYLNIRVNPTAFPVNLKGIKIQGCEFNSKTVTSLLQLVDEINRNSCLGIKARIPSGSDYSFQLYASTGLNIYLDLAGNREVYELFNRSLPLDQTFVAPGRIQIRSAFGQLSISDPHRILGTEETVIPLNYGSIASIRFDSPEDLIEARYHILSANNKVGLDDLRVDYFIKRCDEQK